MRTFTAMYDSRADAERVQAELEKLGIIDTDGVNIHDQSSQGFSRDSHSSYEDKGLWASIKGAFLPDEDRHTYEEGMRRGHYLLTVNVDDEHADRVHDILENSNGVDVDERASQWKQEGWRAPTMGASMAGSAMGTGAQDTAGRQTTEERIPIVDEQLKVGKREVSRGGVRVRSYVVETPVHEQVSLREEHVNVERRPTDQKLAAGDGDPFRERSIEMTETSEEAVVAKEARVKEEMVVRKDVTDRVQNIDDSVRHTEVDVERLADNDRTSQTDRLAARDGDLNRTDRDDKLR